MIWNWIKNLFKFRREKDPHEEMFETNDYTVEELEKMKLENNEEQAKERIRIAEEKIAIQKRKKK